MQSAISTGPVRSRTLRRAGKIVANPSHPGHKLFEVLPSGRRLRSIRTKTSRHKTSFFPGAVGLSNKAPTPQACVMLTHTTLHTAHCTSTFALLPCFLYCSTYCVCVVLIVFVCFMFTVCTYTPEQIPGRCKPTWQ